MKEEFDILVVEDDRNVRDLLRIHLRAAGYSVRLAADASQAEREFSARRPDLALLDFILPGIDGLELARRFRATPGPAVPVLFLTASRDDAMQDRALAMSESAFLAKPVSKDVLLGAVRGLIASSLIG